MRHRRQRIQGKAGAAVLLMVVFLILGGKACEDGKGIDSVRQEFSWKTGIQKMVLEGAVGFLSPAFDLVWQRQEQGMEQSQQMAETVGKGSYLQTLLWEEQRRAMQLTGGQSGSVIHIQKEENTMTPEDMAEWWQMSMERDEDLLAEIDRENEVMRQQAELLQAQKNQQEEVQTGISAGQEQRDPQQPIGIRSLALPYTEEQLGNVEFLKTNLYNVNRGTTVSAELLDTEKWLSMDMTWEAPDSGGPKVLIHHTHATEYFADSNERDETTLIVGVGDYLEELLESRYGIQVIHDRTVYPYNEAYSQALKNVESILKENPTIEVFIDLHRDAGGTKKYTVNVEGKEMAHLMFFNGLSHSANGPIDYLPNENQQANLAFSFQMKMAGDSLYPGLCKRNYLKAYRYNLHVLPRAVIVEVGDNNNTLQEAKNAMEPLARILHLILEGEE